MNRKILKLIVAVGIAFVAGCLVLGHVVSYSTAHWKITSSEINHGVKDFSIFGTSRSISQNFVFQEFEDGAPWKLGCAFDSKMYHNTDNFSIEVLDDKNLKTYEAVLPITSSDSWGAVGVGRVNIELKNDKNWIIIRSNQNIILKVLIIKKVIKEYYFSRFEQIMGV